MSVKTDTSLTFFDGTPSIQAKLSTLERKRTPGPGQYRPPSDFDKPVGSVGPIFGHLPTGSLFDSVAAKQKKLPGA